LSGSEIALPESEVVVSSPASRSLTDKNRDDLIEAYNNVAHVALSAADKRRLCAGEAI
jgi:hypothetical protein